MLKHIPEISILLALVACKSDDSRRENMVLVAAGPFAGCGTSLCRALTEQPAIEGFSIDRNEVTVAEFKRCIASGKCSKSAVGDEGPRTPAAVTWEQADALCASRGARLPTAAEWEKAARGALLLSGRYNNWTAGADESVFMTPPDRHRSHAEVHLDAHVPTQPFRCARS